MEDDKLNLNKPNKSNLILKTPKSNQQNIELSNLRENNKTLSMPKFDTKKTSVFKINYKNNQRSSLVQIRGSIVANISLKNKQLDYEGDGTIKYTEYEKAIYLAKTCLDYGRLEDCLFYIEEAISNNSLKDISPETRDLVVSCFKSFIYEKKEAYKNLLVLDLKEREHQSKYSRIISEIMHTSQKEIYKMCERQILIVNKYLLPKAVTSEDKACYLKIKADCYRYMSEVSSGEILLINKQNCTQFYRESIDYSKELPNTNVYKIGAYLNFSVYCYDILQNIYLALSYATYALKNAMKDFQGKDIEKSENEKWKESLDLLHILKDNISEWTSEIDGEHSVTHVDKQDKAKSFFKNLLLKKHNK